MFNPSAALFANTMLMFRLRFFHNKKPAEAGFLMLPYCKHPGKADHSHLEIFLHTDYVPGGDRHAQSPIHRTPDHRR
ncbi:hypothetical protein L1K12_27060, partial [Klebsiella pneumoniae]|uniref:hypothetical protein n=1 Tax=Klebsiella pneumoniae TaxID=573 RepID=UPI001F292978